MRFSLNNSATNRNFGTGFSPFVRARRCAHFEKKSWQNLYWLPRYSSRSTEDDDFPGFFHCFTAYKLIFLFNGLESRVGDFFIVCATSRAFFIVKTVWENSKRLLRYAMFPVESWWIKSWYSLIFYQLSLGFNFCSDYSKRVVHQQDLISTTESPGKSCCWWWWWW